VAVVQVDGGAVGGPGPVDVEALAEHFEGVVGFHGPLLGVGAVAGVNLDRVEVGGAGRPVVQAQALVAGDRAGGTAGAVARGGAGGDGPHEALRGGGAGAVLRGDRHGAGAVGGRGAGDDSGRGDRQAGGQACGRVAQGLSAGGVLAAEGDGGCRLVDEAGPRAWVGQRDRLAQLAGGYRERAGQRQARAGVADLDAVVAGAGRPRVGGGIPVLEVLLGQRERDGGGGSGGEVDPLEALELKRRLAGGGRVGHVELCDVRAGAGAGVGDRGGDGRRAARGQRAHLEVAERERRVRQAIPEREQRGQALAVIPAVAHVDSLGVLHVAAGARPLRRGRG